MKKQASADGRQSPRHAFRSRLGDLDTYQKLAYAVIDQAIRDYFKGLPTKSVLHNINLNAYSKKNHKKMLRRLNITKRNFKEQKANYYTAEYFLFAKTENCRIMRDYWLQIAGIHRDKILEVLEEKRYEEMSIL